MAYPMDDAVHEQNLRAIVTMTGLLFKPLAVLATCLLLVISAAPTACRYPNVQGRHGELVPRQSGTGKPW